MQKIAEEEGSDLPQFVNATDEEIKSHWDLWTYWRATEGRFLPSQLMREPVRPLQIILELDYIYRVIEKQVMDEKSKEQKDPLLDMV